MNDSGRDKHRRWLCNLKWVSQDSGLELVWFGTQAEGPLRYDYEEDFGDFVRRILAEGIAVDGLLFLLPEVYEIPPGIENCPLPTAALLSDWNLNFLATRIALQVFDAVFLDWRGAQLLREHPAVRYFNMYGLHTQAFARPDGELADEDLPWDIVFVGNLNPSVQQERGRILRRVLRLRDRLRVRIETSLYGEACIQLLHQAKLIFNWSIRGEANMRVFETLTCGKPVIIERSNKEIGLFLTPEAYESYDQESLESVLEALATDSRRRRELIEAARRQKDNWECSARWRMLGELLDSVTMGRRRGSPNPLLQRVIAAHFYGSQTCFKRILDQHLGSEMSLEQASIVLGILAMQAESLPNNVDLARKIFLAAQTLRSGLFWRIFYLARVLRKADNRYWPEELELWRQAFVVLQEKDPVCFEGPVFYDLPETRHAELQKALWNLVDARAFPEGPDPQRYFLHMTWHRIGELFILLQRVDDAKKYLWQAIREYAHHAPTWWRLAEVLSPNSAERRNALEMAFELDPLNPLYAVEYARELRTEGEMDALRHLLEELDGLWPLQCAVYTMEQSQREAFERDLNDWRAELMR